MVPHERWTTVKTHNGKWNIFSSGRCNIIRSWIISPPPQFFLSNSKRTNLILPKIWSLLFQFTNHLFGVMVQSVQDCGLLSPFTLDGIWGQGGQRQEVGRSKWVLAGLCSGDHHPILVPGAPDALLLGPPLSGPSASSLSQPRPTSGLSQTHLLPTQAQEVLCALLECTGASGDSKLGGGTNWV